MHVTVPLWKGSQRMGMPQAGRCPSSTWEEKHGMLHRPRTPSTYRLCSQWAPQQHAGQVRQSRRGKRVPRGWERSSGSPEMTHHPRGTLVSLFWPVTQDGKSVPAEPAHSGAVCVLCHTGPLTFSLCRALFSSPSTSRSFLATPMQGRSVRTPRWQATPKPAGAKEDEAGAVSPVVRSRGGGHNRASPSFPSTEACWRARTRGTGLRAPP